VGSTATARNGAFRIGVRCNSTAPCVGAFVVYSERDLTIKGRFAGSDFRVPAETTATIEVALTKVGEETLRRGPQRAATYLWLQRPGHRPSFGFGGSVMLGQAKS
jgi:hypothetical protein